MSKRKSLDRGSSLTYNASNEMIGYADRTLVSLATSNKETEVAHTLVAFATKEVSLAIQSPGFLAISSKETDVAHTLVALATPEPKKKRYKKSPVALATHKKTKYPSFASISISYPCWY